MNTTIVLPSIVDSNGYNRVLGRLRPHVRHALPMFSDHYGELPQNQWQEMELESYASVPVLDQGHSSSCVGHGSAAGVMFSRIQMGEGPLIVSPTFLYSLINNGVDQGAVVSDALVALKSYGICLMSEVGENLLFRSQMPASAFNSALNHRVYEAYACNSFSAIVSAISLGMPVVFGIEIDNNFSNLNSNGVVPPPSGQILGGHCLCVIGSKYSSTLGWMLRVRNSWGAKWGINGDCYLTMQHFTKGTDAFAIESMIPEEPSVPPVVQLQSSSEDDSE